MTKEINLEGKIIEYTLKKSKCVKSVRLVVDQNAEVIVTIPHIFKEIFAKRFIKEKYFWIIKAIKRQEEIRKKRRELKVESYKEAKERSRRFINERIEHFNKYYNFKINRIVVKNHRSRWGSCSSKNNLNFNYRILFLPEKLSDYVIVHELCHLKEMNHSKKFWELVEKKIKDHKEIRKELKKIYICS